jgi:hypothetical protein
MFPLNFRGKPIQIDQENLFASRRYVENFHGFAYRNFYHMMKEVPSTPGTLNLRWWVAIMWIKLKVITVSFTELTGYARLFFKECMSHEGLASYEDYLEEFYQIHHNANKLKIVTAEPVQGLDRRGADRQRARKEKMESNPFFPFMDQATELGYELLIPTSVAPVWDIPSKNKMRYAAFRPATAGECESFRSNYKAFIRKYAPEKVFIPPDNVHVKMGSAKYNDGGESRSDIEKPINSYNSGFRLQVFITKPNQKREVWLPGKSIKSNNAWIDAFVSSICNRVPYGVNDRPIDEVWESIKDQIYGEKVYFDLSGFGFQFPREYLYIMSEVIQDFYPHEKVKEHFKIMEEIFRNVQVQKADPDYEFFSKEETYRGTGLGYYEKLKATAIWAIMDKHDPISAYGDQMILPVHKYKPDRMKTMMALNQPMFDLLNHGFILDEGYDQKKYHTVGTSFVWSGSLLTPDGLFTPKSLWTDLLSPFTMQFHWERKEMFKSLDLRQVPYWIWKRLPYVYERAFGYEFYRGESYNHFDNLGINPHGQIHEGYLKDWKLAMLPTPGLHYENSVLHNNPFGKPIGTSEAKKFQIKRKKLWKTSKRESTIIRDYVHPKIEMEHSQKPRFTKLGAMTPMHADVRLLLYHGASTGKVNAGLDGQESIKASYDQRYARDVFLARASGGYKVTTLHKGLYAGDPDVEALAHVMDEALKNTTPFYAHRVDVENPNPDFAEMDSVDRTRLLEKLNPVLTNPAFAEIIKFSDLVARSTSVPLSELDEIGNERPLSSSITDEIEEIPSDLLELDLLDQASDTSSLNDTEEVPEFLDLLDEESDHDELDSSPSQVQGWVL